MWMNSGYRIRHGNSDSNSDRIIISIDPEPMWWRWPMASVQQAISLNIVKTPLRVRLPLSAPKSISSIEWRTHIQTRKSLSCRVRSVASVPICTIPL